MNFGKLVCIVAILFSACTCSAQMYTVTDLGTLGGSSSSAFGISPSAQIVGSSLTSAGCCAYHAFRTAPKSTINPATDDLGTLGGYISNAFAINSSGQVVGTSTINGNQAGGTYHAFRTASNGPIDPTSDDLGTLGGNDSFAYGINSSGQVVGVANTTGDAAAHALRTAANRPIDPATDDLGTLGGTFSLAAGINASGQVVGLANASGDGTYHAFRTAANRPINPATDDLGTLGGISWANAVNDFGDVVGGATTTTANESYHAFRTAANSPINPATDDLGTLGGPDSDSEAYGINGYGEVVGYSGTLNGTRAFLYSTGVMHDLNELIPAGFDVPLALAEGINDAGQIAVRAWGPFEEHAVLLTPIYKAFVQQPINTDGSSVFKANRGVIPVKFALTQYGTQPSCTLPATIAVTRASGGTLAAVDESIYSMSADNGSNFRIDSRACQYVYNLAASALGVGTYRVDISINGIMVGHAVFALK